MVQTLSHRVKRLTLHDSDGNGGGVKEFRHYHVVVKKWPEIAYNFVIENGYSIDGKHFDPARNGLVMFGRALDWSAGDVRPSSHAPAGYAICVVGPNTDAYAYEYHGYSRKQVNSAIKLLSYLVLRLNLPLGAINSHHELDRSRRCPGRLPVELIRARVIQELTRVRRAVEGAGDDPGRTASGQVATSTI